MSTPGERINQLRKKKGISPAELARRISTDRQRVYNWIKDDNKPRQDVLEKLARELETTPEYILFGNTASASTSHSTPESQLRDIRRLLHQANSHLSEALARLDHL